MEAKQEPSTSRNMSNENITPSAPPIPDTQRIKRFGKDIPVFGGKISESFDNWSWTMRQCIKIEQMSDSDALLN